MDSVPNTYSDLWLKTVGLPPTALIESIRSICLRDSAQNSKFRSLYWRLLLNVLSTTKSAWMAELEYQRDQYSLLKQQYCTDPRCQESGDAGYLFRNNPLSLEDDNPWQQFFSDNELRACINQDVERTFPELEYFQLKSVRKMMSDILFVYGRHNPHLAYKQGMHEILGPLIFVLYFDQQAYAHAKEVDTLSELSEEDRSILKCMMNESFLEHDSYQLFVQAMSIVQPWYFSPETNFESPDSDPSNPFETLSRRPQDSGPTNALVLKLNFINDTVLKRIDLPLYEHLESLEIAPQIYGIRWLRLLFGREFPIQDLFCLWDAIFANGSPHTLVDFVFVAMLYCIRDLLLTCDYTSCLHYLMRYPPAADVHSLIKLALHFYQPNTFAKPRTTFQKYSSITVTGRTHPNVLNARENKAALQSIQRDNNYQRSKSVTNPTGVSMVSAASLVKGLESGSKMLEGKLNKMADTGRKVVASDMVQNNLATIAQNSQILQGNSSNVTRQNSSSATTTPQKTSTLHTRSQTSSPKPILIQSEQIELMQEQISCLQSRVNELELDNSKILVVLHNSFDVLQDKLPTLVLEADDPLLLALNTMEQVLISNKSVSSRASRKTSLTQASSSLNQESEPPSVNGDVTLPPSASPALVSVDTGHRNVPIEIGHDASNSAELATPPPMLDPLRSNSSPARPKSVFAATGATISSARSKLGMSRKAPPGEAIVFTSPTTPDTMDRAKKTIGSLGKNNEMKEL